MEFEQLRRALSQALSEKGIDIDQSNEKGSSMVFIYSVVGKVDTFGQKYRKIKGNYFTSIASETTRQLLARQYWKECMNALDPASSSYSDNAIANGRLFELISSVYT